MMVVHYNGVTMVSIASQITSLTIVHSVVYSGAEFPEQMASYAENVSIWWLHHDPTKQDKYSIYTM